MKRRIRLLCYFVLFGVGCLFVWNIRFEPKLKMKVIYALSMENSTTCEIFFDMGDGYEPKADIVAETDDGTYSGYQQELYFEIPRQYHAAQGVKLVFNSHEPQRLKSIELYQNGVCVEKLSINQIWEQFDLEPEDCVRLEAPYLIMDVRESIVTLSAGPEFMERFNRVQNEFGKVRWNLTGFLALVLLIAVYIDCGCKKGKALLKKLYLMAAEHGEELSAYVTEWILPGLLGLAMLLVFLMAYKSPLYAHPDENVSRMAIDYYMGRWLPTSFDSNWVSGTFSAMGHARLTEPTGYYFFAGKLGWLISFLTDSPVYYRMLNVLLFVVLCMFAISKRRTHPWLMLCVAVNPQLWYIASYATSDMWDYFWGFFIIWEIGYEKSLLNAWLNGEKKKAWKGLLLSGFLFANLFLGKKNYWIILMFTFFAFLIRLFFEKAQPKINLFVRYMGSLFTTGVFLVIVAGIRRLGIWFYASRDIHEGINALDPVFASAEGTLVNMRGQGYTLKEMLDRGFFSELWRSFTGDYGWLEYWGSSLYHWLFGLVLLLCVGILLYTLRGCGRQRLLESILVVALWGGMVLLVIYQCWTGDYEPQGRYLLPCLLLWGYLCRMAGERPWKKAGWAACLLGLNLLSVYSFLFVGMENLVF